MKKKLYALSGVFLIVLVIAGLWATKATNLTSVEQTLESSQATTLAEKLSVRQMTIGADLIVQGRCLKTQSQWFDRSLFTLASIAVTDNIKGNNTTVKLVLPGGIDTDRQFPVAMIYPDAPQMYPTQEAILFLQSYKGKEIPDGYTVMGFSQGMFSIAKDPTGAEMVTPGLANAGIQKGVGVARGPRQALQLSKFKEMVRGYLNSEK
jgi:hypothetical protein